jgi:hypothetical protein
VKKTIPTPGALGRTLSRCAEAVSLLAVAAFAVLGFAGIQLAWGGDTSPPPPVNSEIRVTFSPSPIKTGYEVDRTTQAFTTSLQTHVVATVSPPMARDSITFAQMWEADGWGRITIGTPIKVGSNQWKFDVGGTYQTRSYYPNGDIWLYARDGERNNVGMVRVIVIVPKTQTRVVPAAGLENSASYDPNLVFELPPNWRGFSVILGSKSTSLVQITFKDQFGNALDSIYDGHNVVVEELSGDAPNIVIPIVLPPGNDLANGVKLDETGLLPTTDPTHHLMTQAEIDSWRQGGGYQGHTNICSVMGLSVDLHIGQKLWVRGHAITPDYNRLIQIRPVEQSPVTITDQPAP